MASKYTQSIQQTGAGSKKTADMVSSRETTVDLDAENCHYVNVLDVRAVN